MPSQKDNLDEIIPPGYMELVREEYKEWKDSPLNSWGIDARWSEPLADWMFDYLKSDWKRNVKELESKLNDMPHYSVDQIPKFLSFIGYSFENPEKQYVPGTEPPPSLLKTLNAIIALKLVEFEGQDKAQDKFLTEHGKVAWEEYKRKVAKLAEANKKRADEAKRRIQFMIPHVTEERGKHPSQTKNCIAERLHSRFPEYKTDWISRIVPEKRK